MFGKEQPAFAAAGFIRGEQEIAAAAARDQPGTVELVVGEAADARRDFGQRSIARAGAIGQIDRIEAAQAQQQRVDAGRAAALVRLGQPLAQTPAHGLYPGQAGHRIARRLAVEGPRVIHPSHP